MKNLVLFNALLISTTTTNSLFATCLDKVPQNKIELNKEIKHAEMEYQVSLENRSLYEELAKSANDRKNLSKITLVSAFLPLAAITGANYGIAGIVGGSLSYAIGGVSALVTEGTFLTISIVDLVKGLKSGAYTLPDEAKIPVGECSYKKMQEDLTSQQLMVMEDKFDSSVIHTIIDHITLGRLSSKATFKLYELAHLKAFLAEGKLKELKEMKL
jgi:hypothetical protein